MKYSKIILIAIFILIAIVPGITYARDPYIVAILSAVPIPDLEGFDDPFVAGIKAGFEELGYVEGETLTYLYSGTFSSMDPETIQEEAQAIVEAEPDVIIVLTSVEALILKELTDDIPIVFGVNEDPVGAGLVESLLEPGGNITGIDDNNPDESRLQIMKETDPTLSKVYYPYNPQSPLAAAQVQSMMDTAEELDIELVPVEVTDVESVQEAIETIPEDIDGIFQTVNPVITSAMTEWHAAALSLQAIMSSPSAVETEGCVLGYGVDMVAIGQQAANMAERILRGADPAVTPVEPAEHFLLVNLEVAAEIDLDVPRAILRRADVIVRPGD